MKPPLTKALVFGANSAIATAFCRLLAVHGASFHLVGRDHAALEGLAADLTLRGALTVSVSVADLAKIQQHEQLVATGWGQLDGPDLALLAYGSLGSQFAAERDWNLQREQIQNNFLSQQSLLTHLANRFEDQGKGCLAAISSVAADRGRASNYIYGAAKAALSCYLSGLRQRLAPSQVRVLDLRPGWVDTPMTAGFHKGLLWSSPERVARGMYRALTQGNGTVYLPAWWRPIMAVIRLLPEAVIRKIGV